MPVPTAEAAAGVADPALQRLLIDHWEDSLARYPEGATRLGDHRYDGRLSATGPAASAAARAARDAFFTRAARLDRGALPAGDQLTLDLFVDQLSVDAAQDVCRSEQWEVSARMNPLVDLEYLPELQPVVTVTEARALAARYRAAPAYVAGTIENLRQGIAQGRTQARGTVEKMVPQLRGWLATPCEDTALLAPLREPHPSWSDDERAGVERELRAGAGEVCVAIGTFADFVEHELLPASRPEGRTGVSSLPDGAACYAARIRAGSSLSMPAAEIHNIGVAELDRIHAEMRAQGALLFNSTDLPTILRRLRDDRSLYFESGDAVQAAATAALDKANRAVPALFGRLPRATCVVKPVPDHEAAWTTIAYYRPGVPDGSQPGEYRINRYAPETRPRFEAEVLAFHESVPGHHLQISIAQELPALPAFRKNALTNAYIEGWALYTERLADEAGLYSTPLDRMGMLSFDAWRASRLVVDTGIHAMGWSRAQAIDFMMENTALTRENIENEVDRYISWPGQALGYKLGQLEILRLRAEAKERLGPRFSLPDFHDALLGQGPLPLPILRHQLEAWTAAQARP